MTTDFDEYQLRISDMPNPELIPPNIKDAIDRYFQHRMEPGSFTRAVLANDLIGAYAHADRISIKNLGHICAYLQIRCPGKSTGTWGSHEAVDNFLSGNA